MTTTADLSRRLGDALGAHLATLEERRSITDAMDEAESWADLSPALRGLVEEIESRPGLVEAGGETASALWDFHLAGQHDQSTHGHGGALTGQAALDAVPAKLTPAPDAHFGDNTGASLDAPEGAGSAEVLSEYEGVEYFRINGQLRQDKLSAETAARVADIDKTMAVSPLEHDVDVHRGFSQGNKVFGSDAWHGDVVDWDDFDHGTDRWEAGERPNLTGLRFREKGYLSTSADPRVADAFIERRVRFQRGAGTPGLEGEPVVMRMRVRKGTGAVQLGKMAPEWGKKPTGSAEILLRRGLRMRVTADHGVDEGGIRRLDIEVLND